MKSLIHVIRGKQVMLDKVKDSIGKICCDVIELDGTLPVQKNVEKIINRMENV